MKVSEKDRKAKVAIIVPQRKEYNAVAKVFSIPPGTAHKLPHDGTYVISKIKTETSLQPIRLYIARIDNMYN